MHEHHRQAADALVQNGLQPRPQNLYIQDFEHHHAYALIHFNHRFVKQVRLFDLQVEDVGTVLVATLQEVPETAGTLAGASS